MSKTILVIEDNEQNLYLMRFLLEAYGLEVLEASDGQTGYRAGAEASSRPPSCSTSSCR